MNEPAAQVIETFVERLGVVAQGDGLPRIAGRIMAYLVIHGGPVRSGELAEELRVSRASISTNSRLLASLGVIERVTRPGERQDYFQLRSDPYVEMLHGYASRLQKAQEAVAEARENLDPDEWGDALARLGELGRFYDDMSDLLETMIERGHGSGNQTKR